MITLVTRQNENGTFDEVGMNNRRIYREYQSVRSALRYAARDWVGTLRFEFFPDQGFMNPATKPFRTAQIIRHKETP